MYCEHNYSKGELKMSSFIPPSFGTYASGYYPKPSANLPSLSLKRTGKKIPGAKKGEIERVKNALISLLKEAKAGDQDSISAFFDLIEILNQEMNRIRPTTRGSAEKLISKGLLQGKPTVDPSISNLTFPPYLKEIIKSAIPQDGSELKIYDPLSGEVIFQVE